MSHHTQRTAGHRAHAQHRALLHRDAARRLGAARRAPCSGASTATSQMPQRKDPDIPVRLALALASWPGASAEKIEQLVTRRIEEKIAENVRVEKIESNTRTGIAAVYITLDEGATDTRQGVRRHQAEARRDHRPADGAGPIEFVKDFGDTAALMLTVASPKVGDARDRAARAGAAAGDRRERAPSRRRRGGRARHARAARCRRRCPPSSSRRPLRLLRRRGRQPTACSATPRSIEGPGFVGVDVATDSDDASCERVRRALHRASGCARPSSIPTSGRSAVVRDPADTAARLAAVAGDKYTLPRARRLHRSRSRARCRRCRSCRRSTRSGVLEERIYLDYSQERLAAYGVKRRVARATSLGARNITVPGGVIEVGRQEPHASIRRASSRASRRSATCWSRPPTARRSTCATWSTSSAATRARRGS